MNIILSMRKSTIFHQAINHLEALPQGKEQMASLISCSVKLESSSCFAASMRTGISSVLRKFVISKSVAVDCKK